MLNLSVFNVYKKQKGVEDSETNFIGIYHRILVIKLIDDKKIQKNKTI